MPDVYVPLDTTQYTKLHRELAAKSCITSTTLKWIDKNRSQLIKRYNVEAFTKARTLKLANKTYKPEDLRKGFLAYKAEFTATDDIIDLLLQKAKEAKIEYNDSTLQASMPMLKAQIKALIARDLWDMSEYYEIMNPYNEIYVQGLKAIKDEKMFEGIKQE